MSEHTYPEYETTEKIKGKKRPLKKLLSYIPKKAPLSTGGSFIGIITARKRVGGDASIKERYGLLPRVSKGKAVMVTPEKKDMEKCPPGFFWSKIAGKCMKKKEVPVESRSGVREGEEQIRRAKEFYARPLD